LKHRNLENIEAEACQTTIELISGTKTLNTSYTVDGNLSVADVTNVFETS